MGSSSKKKGSVQQQAPVTPEMGTQTGLPNGDIMQYFMNQSQIPQGQTGMVRPASVPGMLQGVGLNVATAPPPRQQLAQAIAQPTPGIYNNNGPRPYTGGRWSR